MSDHMFTHENAQGITHYRLYNHAIVQSWGADKWNDLNTGEQWSSPALSELFVSSAGEIYVSRYDERFQLMAGEWVQVTR